MKQEATLFGVVQDNTEAPHKINITESQNSGLANVTEPMGKVKKKGTAALRVEYSHTGLCIVKVVCSASLGVSSGQLMPPLIHK